MRNRTAAYVIGCLALLSGLMSPALAAERPPNFVILFADDLGYGDLGCYGHPTIRTPNLDRMAAEGMRFTQFYCAAPVCTPSRAALLTGRLPMRSGMAGHGERRVLYTYSTGGLPASEITIPEMLKSRGYTTALVGKWHLGHLPEYLPTRNGFDSFFGIPYSNDMPPRPLMRNEEVIEQPATLETLTPRYTEEAIKFLKANREKPFFLELAYTYPHVPLAASDKFRTKSLRGLFGDVVEEVDWSVGEVLKTLRELGLAENTLVVFSSDNGPWLIKRLDGGSAGLLKDGKGSTWEGGMREPGIFWWPGKIKPAVTTTVACTMDLLPTFGKLAGAEVPTDRVLDGQNVAPVLLEGASMPDRPYFFWRADLLMAVRKGPWKLHLITQPGYGTSEPTKQDPPLLFNVEQDPSEQYDAAKEHPEIVADLLKEIEKHKATIQPVESQLDKTNADAPSPQRDKAVRQARVEASKLGYPIEKMLQTVHKEGSEYIVKLRPEPGQPSGSITLHVDAASGKITKIWRPKETAASKPE